MFKWTGDDDDDNDDVDGDDNGGEDSPGDGDILVMRKSHLAMPISIM